MKKIIKNKNYSMFFKRGISFLFVLVLVETAFGFAAERLFFFQKTGKYSRLTHSISNDKSDILIMGSSHATRHYVPEVFLKGLNKTCYNAGVQGQKILFQSALQKLIFKQNTPELLIFNIDEDWMYLADTAYERLADLYPYYWDNREELKPVFSLRDRFVDLKLLSRCFQYNSTILHIIKYFFNPQKDFSGYRPLDGKMHPPKKNNTGKKAMHARRKDKKNKEIDINFVQAFESIINISCQSGVELVFVISPMVKGADISTPNYSLELMLKKAKEKKIPVFDFRMDKSFVHQFQLFYDRTHLNNDGALLFSKKLVDLLKTYPLSANFKFEG